MFFKKERKNKIIYTVVAVFFVVLIFLTTMTIVYLFAKNGSKMINSDDTLIETDEKKTEIRVFSPAELVENYKKELLNLKSRVENGNRGKEEILADAEQTFLSVSVPDEFRDSHLRYFLKIREIQKNSADYSKESVAISLNEFIEKIISQPVY